MAMSSDSFLQMAAIPNPTTVSQKNDEKDKVARNTKGLGDCGFHAILGEWDGQQYECKNIEDTRKQLAKEVREAKEGDILFPLIKAGIEALVMENAIHRGPHMARLCRDYQAHTAKDEASHAWQKFEAKLKQYTDILKYIHETVTEQEKREKSLITLKDVFQFCLNKSQGNLHCFIQLETELNAAYLDYKQIVNTGFSLNQKITRDVIQEYAAYLERAANPHLGTSGNWLLPLELNLIAHVFKRRVVLYTKIKQGGRESSQLLDTFNRKAVIGVDVEFNGNDHYKRVITRELAQSQDLQKLATTRDDKKLESKNQAENPRQFALYHNTEIQAKLNTLVYEDNTLGARTIIKFIQDLLKISHEDMVEAFRSNSLSQIGNVFGLVGFLARRDIFPTTQVEVDGEAVSKPNIHDSSVTNISGWYRKDCLIFILSVMIETYLQVKHGILDYKHLNINKSLLEAFLLNEIWILTNSYSIYSIYHKILYSNSNTKEENIREIVKIFMQAVKDNTNREEFTYCLPGGYANHAIYQVVIYDRQKNQFVVRVDNSSLNITTHFKPYILPKDEDELIAYLTRSILQISTSNLGQGRQVLQQIDSERVFKTEETDYIIQETQEGSNCAFAGFLRGMNVRSSFIPSDDSKSINTPTTVLMNWVTSRMYNKVAQNMANSTARMIVATTEKDLYQNNIIKSRLVSVKPLSKLALPSSNQDKQLLQKIKKLIIECYTDPNQQALINQQITPYEQKWLTIHERNDLQNLLYQLEESKAIIQNYVESNDEKNDPKSINTFPDAHVDKKFEFGDIDIISKQIQMLLKKENLTQDDINQCKYQFKILFKIQYLRTIYKSINVLDKKIELSVDMLSAIYVSNEYSYKDKNRDRVLRSKIDAIFDLENSNNYRKVQIHGAAGIGKTILCHQIISKWTNGYLWNDKFEWIIWLPLKEFNQKIDGYSTSIGDMVNFMLFNQQGYSKNLSAEDIYSFIFNHLKGKILFLLDGYDELNESSPFKKTINDILLSEDNPNYVIVTGRPFHQKLNNYKLFEIKGFNLVEIKSYIYQFFQDKKSAKKLCDWLVKNPSVYSLMNVPSLLGYLCYLWEKPKSREALAKENNITLTSICENLVLQVWQLYESQDKPYAPGIEDTDKRIHFNNNKKLINQYLEILSFTMLSNNKYSIEIDEAIEIGYNIFKDTYKLDHKNDFRPYFFLLNQPGFLYIGGASGNSASYYFTHKIIQEYFAASYITNAFVNKKTLSIKANSIINEISVSEFIKENKYYKRYELVWWFTAGKLSRLNGINDFFNILKDEPIDIWGPYHVCLLIRCLEEASLHQDIKDKADIYKKMMTWIDKIISNEREEVDNIRSIFIYNLKISPRVVLESKLNKILEKLTYRVDDEAYVVNEWENGNDKKIEKKHFQINDDNIQALNLLTEIQTNQINILPHIIKNLDEGNNDAKFAALRIISKLGLAAANESILQKILKLIEITDQHNAIRFAVSEIFEILGPIAFTDKIKKKLLIYLQSGDDEIRYAAANIIKKLGVADYKFIYQLIQILYPHNIKIRKIIRNIILGFKLERLMSDSQQVELKKLLHKDLANNDAKLKHCALSAYGFLNVKFSNEEIIRLIYKNIHPYSKKFSSLSIEAFIHLTGINSTYIQLIDKNISLIQLLTQKNSEIIFSILAEIIRTPKILTNQNELRACIDLIIHKNLLIAELSMKAIIKCTKLLTSNQSLINYYISKLIFFSDKNFKIYKISNNLLKIKKVFLLTLNELSNIDTISLIKIIDLVLYLVSDHHRSIRSQAKRVLKNLSASLKTKDKLLDLLYTKNTDDIFNERIFINRQMLNDKFLNKQINRFTRYLTHGNKNEILITLKILALTKICIKIPNIESILLTTLKKQDSDLTEYAIICIYNHKFFQKFPSLNMFMYNLYQSPNWKLRLIYTKIYSQLNISSFNDKTDPITKLIYDKHILVKKSAIRHLKKQTPEINQYLFFLSKNKLNENLQVEAVKTIKRLKLYALTDNSQVIYWLNMLSHKSHLIVRKASLEYFLNIDPKLVINRTRIILAKKILQLLYFMNSSTTLQSLQICKRFNLFEINNALFQRVLGFLQHKNAAVVLLAKKILKDITFDNLVSVKNNKFFRANPAYLADIAPSVWIDLYQSNHNKYFLKKFSSYSHVSPLCILGDKIYLYESESLTTIELKNIKQFNEDWLEIISRFVNKNTELEISPFLMHIIILFISSEIRITKTISDYLLPNFSIGQNSPNSITDFSLMDSNRYYISMLDQDKYENSYINFLQESIYILNNCLPANQTIVEIIIGYLSSIEFSKENLNTDSEYETEDENENFEILTRNNDIQAVLNRQEKSSYAAHNPIDEKIVAKPSQSDNSYKVSSRQIMNYLTDNNFTLGSVKCNEDTFYSAILQCISVIEKFPYKRNLSINFLREICVDYVNDLDTKPKSHNWIKRTLNQKEYSNLMDFMNNPSLNLKEYTNYKRLKIEGRILSEKLDIRFKCMSLDKEGRIKHFSLDEFDFIYEKMSIYILYDKNCYIPVIRKRNIVSKNVVPTSPADSDVVVGNAHADNSHLATTRFDAKADGNEQQKANHQSTETASSKVTPSSDSALATGITKATSRSAQIKSLAAVTSAKSERSRKGLFGANESKIHDHAKSLLNPMLKEHHFVVSPSYSEGDCFFDALAQGIMRMGKKIPINIEKYGQEAETYEGFKKLRLICHDVILALNKGADEHNWVKKEYLNIATAKIKEASPNETDEKIALEAKKVYDDYVALLPFSAPEVDKENKKNPQCPKTATWGYCQIEGRIICQVFDIKLHLMEIYEEKILTKPAHQMVSKNDVATTTVINFQDKNLVHIVVYRNHYAVLLPEALAAKISNQGLFAPNAAASQIPVKDSNYELSANTTALVSRP